MKEKPILFSSPMVRAILEGRKTQTRRVLKPQPDAWIRGSSGTFGVPKKITTKKPHKNGSIWEEEDGTCYDDINCPFGSDGDRLWVRETWATKGFVNDDDYQINYLYRANLEAEDKPINWKPSIHMPRRAARIILEVTDVRIERLQDISEADAVAEGILPIVGPDSHTYYGNYGNEDIGVYLTPKDSFRTLWNSIHGAGAWERDVFVWAITFKKI